MSHECIYCNAELPPETVNDVPSVYDDEQWDAIADQHAPSCEWVMTRAHRLDMEA